MHDCALQMKALSAGRKETKILRGAINLVARCIPLIFEDKEFFMRSMWHEQAFFNNQINAIKLMDSISVLLFKPGFTIAPYEANHEPSITGIDA